MNANIILLILFQCPCLELISPPAAYRNTPFLVSLSTIFFCLFACVCVCVCVCLCVCVRVYVSVYTIYYSQICLTRNQWPNN
jgi:hypothetical protein